MSHEYEQTAEHKGFKVAALRERFNAITAKLDHWKQAFTCSANGEAEKNLTVAAIEYFTGDGDVKVFKYAKGEYQVITCGYWIATGEGG